MEIFNTHSIKIIIYLIVIFILNYMVSLLNNFLFISLLPFLKYYMNSFNKFSFDSSDVNRNFTNSLNIFSISFYFIYSFKSYCF